jgi:DNA-directed RNA polymerase subunit RPC12/RpoP
MRCVFCRAELDTAHWAFDRVSHQPVPACKECGDRLRVKVWRVDVGEVQRIMLRARERWGITQAG